MRPKKVCHEGDHISAERFQCNRATRCDAGRKTGANSRFQTPQVDLMGSRNLSEQQHRAGPDLKLLPQGLQCQTSAFRFAAAPVWQHFNHFSTNKNPSANN